jgi:hypothetical protein
VPGGIFVDRSFLPDPVMVSLVITSFWLLLADLQDGRTSYLGCAVLTGLLGVLTKISGLIVGLPVVYVVLSTLPEDALVRRKCLIRLIIASVLVITPVIGYYAWAIHIAHTYPPYLVAAGARWVWDTGFESWFKAGYFRHELVHAASWLWGTPLLASALLGLLFPPAPGNRGNLRWLFHWWLLAGIIFYTVGAQEIVQNPWNLHIVDPALAGLAAQGLLVAGAAFARHLPLIGRAAIILIILAMHGLAMSDLRWAYHAYARQGYELGAALARLSQPSDLVVTVANAIGDPVPIYYSRRRGWVFPPVWTGADPWEDIKNEPAAIRLFDQLRVQGAEWFGIVAEQRMKFRQTAPQLLAHIERTTELVDEDRDWAIYRFLPLPH